MQSKTGKRQCKLGILTIIVICVVALLVFSYVFFLCEENGIFPGALISRKIAEKKLKSYGSKSEISSCDFKDGKYVFEINDSDGLTFNMEVDGFRIVYDGYFKKYFEDEESEKVFESTLKTVFEDDVFSDNSALIFYVKTDVIITKEEKIDFDDYEILKNKLKDTNLELNFRSEKIDFDAYRKFVYKVVRPLYECGFVPESLHIFYSYEENGESVLQYESRIDKNQFIYDEDLLSSCKKTHFRVEIPEETAKKYKAKQIVKLIYNVCLIVLIIISVTNALVKYEKRRAGKR